MGRHSTLPTLYEDCKFLSISDLKRWGCLTPNQYTNNIITWSRNGEKYASIRLKSDLLDGKSFIELEYTCSGKPIHYIIQLVSEPSNIGKGFVWFFICPSTHKRCRKLYLVDTYFLHRSAISGSYYEKQTQSKKWRYWDNSPIGREFKLDRIYSQVYKKHFKTNYAGKPTKRFSKLIRQARMAGDDSILELLKIR